jgi:pimeloyl-ACP methyl ester carboxylesterase
MADAPTVVLVHGAWHGPWAWAEVQERLAGDGLEVVTVDLPSIGHDTGALEDLYGDAAAVRETLDAIDGPAVVVAHSYGGAPVTEGAAGADNVAHIVYLTAFMLDEGESLLGLVGGQEPDWWITAADGRTTMPATPETIFYNDCPPETAEAATARLAPQRKATVEQPIREVAWREVPTTYVVCERDNAIPVFAQDAMAQRAGAVRRLDAGHSPFLSQPDELVTVLREVIRDAAPPPA